VNEREHDEHDEHVRRVEFFESTDFMRGLMWGVTIGAFGWVLLSIFVLGIVLAVVS